MITRDSSSIDRIDFFLNFLVEGIKYQKLTTPITVTNGTNLGRFQVNILQDMFLYPYSNNLVESNSNLITHTFKLVGGFTYEKISYPHLVVPDNITDNIFIKENDITNYYFWLQKIEIYGSIPQTKIQISIIRLDNNHVIKSLHFYNNNTVRLNLSQNIPVNYIVPKQKIKIEVKPIDKTFNLTNVYLNITLIGMKFSKI